MLSLVTGATGFVGSHLVEALLLRGEQVRALVRPTSQTQFLRKLGVDIRIGTLSDTAMLMAAAKGVDRVFHCAALFSDWGTEEDFNQANVQGVRNVLGAATRGGVSRFIHLSTTDVYGYPSRPTLESERPSPRGFPYADSRLDGETVIWNHCRQVHLPSCIIRTATVYGPRCEPWVVDMLDLMRKRRMILIDGGRHIVGLTYVGNLVDALILAADQNNDTCQAYNVTDGTQVTWRQYLDALAEQTGVPRITRNFSHTLAFAAASAWETYYNMSGRIQRPFLTRTMVEVMGTDQDFPIDKAQTKLGYRPRVSFEEGMRYTCDWLRQEGLIDQAPLDVRRRA